MAHRAVGVRALLVAEVSDVAARPIRGLALCAGVGGLDLALGLALGEHYRTVCYVEREAYAAAALVARMADQALDSAPVWDDLLTFDARRWRGALDLLSAGYPCQPFSTAGKLRGEKDPRHLWPRVRQIISQCRPRWVILENVSNHLRIGGHKVARDLQRMGYSVAGTLRTASEAGAPHKRERLFILAYREGVERGVQLHSGKSQQAGIEPRGSGEGVADAGRERHQRRGAAREVGGAAPAQLGEACEREWPRDAADDRSTGVGDADEQGLEGRSGSECGGGDELPAWPPGPAERDRWSWVLERWPRLAPAVEPELRGLADGLSPRVDRLRAAGNGVCPEEAADALLELALALGC